MEKNEPNQNKYDAALAKYNTQLDDTEVAAQVAKIIEVSLTISISVPAFVAFSAASFSSSQNPWRIISETDAQSDTTVPR